MTHSFTRSRRLVDLGLTTSDVALTCINAMKSKSRAKANATGYQSVMCIGIQGKKHSLTRQGRLAGDTQERHTGKKKAAVRITKQAQPGAMKGRNDGKAYA
jgi:hypothetical protein